MKALLGKFALFALGVLTIGGGAVRAQITNQLDFKMSQPFTVANTTLPAGTYVVTTVQGTEQSVLEISSMNGKPSVMVETNPLQADTAQSGTHLVFNKYKNVLALSQIFPGGGNQGYQLIQGHPEKLAAKTETPTKQTVAGAAK